MRVWHKVPEVHPSDLRDKLLVAWVAYHSDQNVSEGGKAHCQVSILYLQMLLCYTTSAAAERALTRLRAKDKTKGQPWLEISEPARGVKGHHYRLGPPALSNHEAWVQLGESLFGDGGHLEPFRSRPLFSTFGITPFGAMVLAFVDRFGPVTEKEIVLALKTFFDVNAVRKRLRYVHSEGLVHLKKGRYHTGPNLRATIEKHEIDSGAAEKLRIAENTRDKRWITFQTEVLGNPETRMLKSALRKLDCFYCAKTPPATGGDVEHFPPKKWGGSDKTSLLLPICKKCNGRHGRILGMHKKPLISLTPTRLTMPWDGDLSSAIDHLLARVIAQNFQYAIAMNEGRIDDAYHAAKSIATLWAGVKKEGVSLHIVSKSTGEIKESSEADEFDRLCEYLDNYTGVPGLLARS